MQLSSKYIPSVVKELVLILESYRKKNITAERAMDFVSNLVEPNESTDEVIVKTIAFFWDLDVDTLLKSFGVGYTHSGNYMLRYFLYSKYKNYAVVGRKLGVARETIFWGVKRHKELLEFDKHYKEIFKVVSDILKLK